MSFDNSVKDNGRVGATTKKNPLSQFLSNEVLSYMPEAYNKQSELVRIWSSGKNGIKIGLALFGGWDPMDKKPVVVDVVQMPQWSTANRRQSLAVNADDFRRIKQAKKNCFGLAITHPDKDELIPTLEEWSIFSYLHALYPQDRLIFVIIDPNNDDSELNSALYDFSICKLYPQSFVDLFEKEKQKARKRTHRGQADRPDRGGNE